MSSTQRELTLTVRPGADALDAVAPGVARLPVVFVNAYLVGDPDGPWALVDTGLPGTASRVRAAAEGRYGAGARPEAIVLTHGHFDHAGNARDLAEAWGVPVYAHPLEMPYLTGRSGYAPGDPTVGGALAFLSRFFPMGGRDLGDRVRALPEDGSVPGMEGWRWLHTPGHTAGHVSLFRESDGTLLAGDALATMDLDSWTAQVTRTPELSRPPAPLTPDWEAARNSVGELAALEPRAVAAGHGVPIAREGLGDDLRRLTAEFPVPADGRYTGAPAVGNEHGVSYVPPAKHDPLPRRLAVGAAAAGLLALLSRKRRRR